MKKLALGVLAIGIALATTACSTNTPSPNSYIDQAKSAAGQAEQADQQAAGGALGSDPSSPMCAESGTPEMQALAIDVQLLAQPSLSLVNDMRSGDKQIVTLDFDKMNQAIKEYRVLEGHPAEGFKDPKVVLDRWQDLSDRMAAMIDGPTDPTQADVDAYKAAMGDGTDLIMSQGDVALALDQYCGN
jgi:hypothetical protein